MSLNPVRDSCRMSINVTWICFQSINVTSINKEKKVKVEKKNMARKKKIPLVLIIKINFFKN
jgi:hypothetical protein